jgi:GT2 family glycosyltransferase
MISVAMTAFNGRRFIEAQAASILSQLAQEDELVVADNGSTDGTWQWLTELAAADSRVRALHNTESRGVIANVEFAVRQCRGELIFLADQDDRWLAGKVNRIRAVFASSPRVLLVQSDAELIDESDRPIGPSFYALRDSRPGFWFNFLRNTYQGCTMAFRRELLELALPFPARLPMHDMWFGLLAELAGEVRFIPDRLTAYRRHGENLSGLKPQRFLQILVWRLDLGRALLGAILCRRPLGWVLRGLAQKGLR